MSANLDGTNVVNKMHDPNKDHNAREGDTLVMLSILRFSNIN